MAMGEPSDAVNDRQGRPREGQDESQWGMPVTRPLVGGDARGITVATFKDKYGNSFTRYYGGNADGGMFARRLDPNSPRIHEEVPSYVPPGHQTSIEKFTRPTAPQPSPPGRSPQVRGQRDVGLLGQDVRALGPYQPGNRTYNPNTDVTTVRFDNGYVGTYGSHGTQRLSLAPPPKFDPSSPAFKYVQSLARQRNAAQIPKLKADPKPTPYMVAPSVDSVPKTWMDVANNIHEGAQDVSDWLQYGGPGFHFNPTDAEREQWRQQWLKQQTDPGLADFGRKVAGDVPFLVAAPGQSVALASQYNANVQNAARHDQLAQTAINPAVAAQHRQAAAQARGQNQQIVAAAKDGVGLGPKGLLTRGAQATGYLVGGQPGMAGDEVKQAYKDVVGYSQEHPLLFAANFIPAAGGALKLSEVGMNSVARLGAAGLRGLAAKAIADADVASMDAVTRNQLYDAAAKYQQVADQLAQGKPVGAVRVMAGKPAPTRGVNADYMPPKTPPIVQPMNGASAKAGASSVSGAGQGANSSKASMSFQGTSIDAPDVSDPDTDDATFTIGGVPVRLSPVNASDPQHADLVSRAIEARDALAASYYPINPGEKVPKVVTAAGDPATGTVSAGASGTLSVKDAGWTPDEIAHFGVEQSKKCRFCGELRSAAGTDAPIDQLIFTPALDMDAYPAIKQKPICPECQLRLYRSQFVPGTQFEPVNQPLVIPGYGPENRSIWFRRDDR